MVVLSDWKHAVLEQCLRWAVTVNVLGPFLQTWEAWIRPALKESLVRFEHGVTMGSLAVLTEYKAKQILLLFILLHVCGHLQINSLLLFWSHIFYNHCKAHLFSAQLCSLNIQSCSPTVAVLFRTVFLPGGVPWTHSQYTPSLCANFRRHTVLNVLRERNLGLCVCFYLASFT